MSTQTIARYLRGHSHSPADARLGLAHVSLVFAGVIMLIMGGATLIQALGG